MSRPEILLIYDKECPACDTYCQIVKIRETVGDVKIIDAREKSKVLDEITKLGLDIDQGMVLKMGGQIYYGSDAIHALALISVHSGLLNRINYWIFKSKSVASWLYPVLRLFQNLLLKMLGKTKINNLGTPDNEKF